MNLRHRVEYLSVRAMRAVCAAPFRGLSLAVSRVLGDLWYGLDGRRRGVALVNLRRALGDELDEARLREVARTSFRGLARSFCDTLELDRWDEGRVERYVTLEGWEHIEAAYRQGRGVLLFSGHIGCWEMVPHIQAMRGLPLEIVVRPLDNPLLDTLLDRLRTSTGNRTIPKRRSVRAVLRALRSGRGVAIVIDQNLRSSERIFVEFFGRPAATTPTLALTALRTGAAVVPVFCFPRPGGRYHIRWLPPVRPEPTGDRERDVRELTQRCTALIEAAIREQPGSWLWMHRRWRTVPSTDDDLHTSPEVAEATATH